jgi:RimJ/RimL family protein N-acetyltransferase
MIFTANTDAKKHAMWKFLSLHGVRLQRSEDFNAIGRVSVLTGDLIGVVAFNNFCGRICGMHAAGDGNWISRELIRAAIDYPFHQLGLVALVAAIAADNAKSLRIAQHFGFRELHRVKDGAEHGVDLVFVQMRREECRYLGERDEQRLRDTACA